jgi:NAD(P)-dependent dehydrogenase (short-subunit alcohol dehydrogenase family)
VDDGARRFEGQTVVLAGASSGIGRITARELARLGAAVVVAARGQERLDDVAAEVRAEGGSVLAVATDVADAEAVEALADRALEETGRLDGWVNLAATSVYGTVEQLTAEEFDRVLRVTFLGTVHGCKAAASRMRAREGGTIVNVASVLGVRSVPLQSAYSAAKHAVVGFTDAFRLELEREGGTVRVGLVLPSTMDTPFFAHARSKMDSEPGPYPPVYAPAVAAHAIVHSLLAPQRRLVAGGAGRALDVAQRISPALTDWFLLGPGRVFERQHSHMPNDGQDAFTEPASEHDVGGGRQRRILRASPWTRFIEQKARR